jgi:hypothetical protein
MTTAVATATRQRRERATMPRFATVLLVAEIVIGVALVVALAVIGAADAAGLDLLVPEPGPMPAPIVAPAGLDL